MVVKLCIYIRDVLGSNLDLVIVILIEVSRIFIAEIIP
jgi:hypothetical protein